MSMLLISWASARLYMHCEYCPFVNQPYNSQIYAWLSAAHTYTLRHLGKHSRSDMNCNEIDSLSFTPNSLFNSVLLD